MGQGLQDVRMMLKLVELEYKAVVIASDNHKWRLLLRSCISPFSNTTYY